MHPKQIKITIAYATPAQQELLELAVPEGATLLEAALQSGIAERAPGLDLPAAPKGIHGEVRPNNHKLEDGDRIEIYRPLHQDPKEARRQRAQQ